MVTAPRQNTGKESSDAVVSANEEGLTFRGAAIAIGVGMLLIVLTGLAIRHSEMVTGRYISHGVPPLPAFAAVLFLSLLRPLLRRVAPRLDARELWKEGFATSSARGIRPVVEIDGVPLAALPGPVTLELQRAFDRRAGLSGPVSSSGIAAPRKTSATGKEPA